MDQFKNNLINLNSLHEEYKVICSALNILFHSMKKIDEESTKLELDKSYGGACGFGFRNETYHNLLKLKKTSEEKIQVLERYLSISDNYKFISHL